jgi:hypothetical protein
MHQPEMTSNVSAARKTFKSLAKGAWSVEQLFKVFKQAVFKVFKQAHFVLPYHKSD